MSTKTYIWRMTHYRNIGFILRKGLHCCNGGVNDPDYVNIGHKSLIQQRGQSDVTISPGGVLNDYIPFYFYYKMPMLYSIYKNEVEDYDGHQSEIIYLVSTAEQIDKLKIPYVFTDRHAYVAYRTFYNSLADLKSLKWDIIKDNSWYNNYTQLRKELKQAEFLVYKRIPVNALLGIVCQNKAIANFVEEEIVKVGSKLEVAVKPEYYY